MKRVFTFFIAILLTATTWAQSPEKMNYQAVIRSNSGQLVTSAKVGMQISILQSSASGTAVYVETQTPTTNANGLISIEIGTGIVVSGDVSTIDWGNGPYFIKTEAAVEAPLTTYTITGTSQLLSVPYALHATTAETLTGTINETQTLSEVVANDNSANAQIKNITDPTDAQDAATKAYVDVLLEKIKFMELLIEGFTDSRDGNHYNVVKIGNQIWTAENLKYLPGVVGPATGSQTTPYYYVYGYDGTVISDAKATANYAIYGVLYNWAAAMEGETSSTANPSDVEGVCPTGWHLPSHAEWTTLTTFLGGGSVAGGKLKETSTTHWSSPNTGATNETGFTALPGGYRNYDQTFYYIGEDVFWWGSTESGSNTNTAMQRNVYSGARTIYMGVNFKEAGMYVRCVRD